MADDKANVLQKKAATCSFSSMILSSVLALTSSIWSGSSMMSKLVRNLSTSSSSVKSPSCLSGTSVNLTKWWPCSLWRFTLIRFQCLAEGGRWVKRQSVKCLWWTADLGSGWVPWSGSKSTPDSFWCCWFWPWPCRGFWPNERRTRPCHRRWTLTRPELYHISHSWVHLHDVNARFREQNMKSTCASRLRPNRIIGSFASGVNEFKNNENVTSMDESSLITSDYKGRISDRIDLDWSHPRN